MTLELVHQKCECLICVSNIRNDSPIWSCDNCYNIFHLGCIKKWSNLHTGANDVDKLKMNSRCPTCQKELDISKKSLNYRCFCDKESNPWYIRNRTPHSCGEICSRPNKTNPKCQHRCALPCHPGPCPPCEATTIKDCHCGKARISYICNTDGVVCGNICDKVLNCGIHKCEQLCHAGECETCQIVIKRTCNCNNKCSIEALCGSEIGIRKYFCGNICGKSLECMNHNCENLCHDGKCQSCQWSPETKLSCWCEKHSVRELIGRERYSCLDPIPSCGERCLKIHANCGHYCTKSCHEGICGPCPLNQNVRCRCGKSMISNVNCMDLEKAAVLCKQTCNKKLNCKRHKCTKQCCDSDLHFCNQQCGRLLTCKLHKCDHECGHRGLCPPCPNVSFDELHCQCGTETILPPIACGQLPPTCNKLCTRNHECNHAVRHKCHSRSQCPQCTELTDKSCPGGHQIMKNIPCFRPVVTCGLVCGKPLPNCDHLCNRLCHEGDCLREMEKCNQACQSPRNECNHPCSAPCHISNCELIYTKCIFPVVIKCKCDSHSVNIPCSTLKTIISFMTINKINYQNVSGICCTYRGGKIYTACDKSCKTETSKKIE